MANGYWKNLVATALGALHTHEQGKTAGERNVDSSVSDYQVTHSEVNKTFFNPDATTEQVITSSPALLFGFVGKAGTGTLTLRDSSSAAGSATDFPVYTLAVGTLVSFPGGVRMDSGITAQCSVGTDEVTIFWRPI